MNLPRYSISSLVLFVCLVASAFGLWFRWEPWVLHKILGPHDWSVKSAGFSRNGQQVITNQEINMHRIWNTETGKLLCRGNFHKSYYEHIYFENFEIDWDIDYYAKSTQFRIKSKLEDKSKLLQINSVVIAWPDVSPDESRIAVPGENNTAKIWDFKSLNCLAILKGHCSKVNNAQFSPNGNYLVTASEDKTARVYRRRRPEYWWGLAWLPTFWLTLLFSLGLLWSLARDWRGLRSGRSG